MRGAQRHAPSGRRVEEGYLRCTNYEAGGEMGTGGMRSRWTRNQGRANRYRQQQQSSDFIRLIDGSGDDWWVHGGTQLSDNKHGAVVTALYSRSRRISAATQRGTAGTNYGGTTMWDGTASQEDGSAAPSDRLWSLLAETQRATVLE